MVLLGTLLFGFSFGSCSDFLGGPHALVRSLYTSIGSALLPDFCDFFFCEEAEKGTTI